jgi:hypothetical protein
MAKEHHGIISLLVSLNLIGDDLNGRQSVFLWMRAALALAVRSYLFSLYMQTLGAGR